jgi:hypothetical protein
MIRNYFKVPLLAMNPEYGAGPISEDVPDPNDSLAKALGNMTTADVHGSGMIVGGTAQKDDSGRISEDELD